MKKSIKICFIVFLTIIFSFNSILYSQKVFSDISVMKNSSSNYSQNFNTDLLNTNEPYIKNSIQPKYL
ncbi:Uncharacterised protein [Clostridioides difficile]|nr:Uncharacterised protein [Clostridioides difficile]